MNLCRNQRLAFQLGPRAFRIQTEVRIMSWLTARAAQGAEAGGSRAFISSKVVAHMAMGAAQGQEIILS